MSKDDTQHALVPRLRFPEFRKRRVWTKRELGALLEETARPVQMSDDEEYSLVTVKRRYGGVVFRERLRGDLIRVKSQFLVLPDDFLISKRQIVHNACGLVLEELSGSIVSNEYSVLTAKPGCDIRFIEYFAQQPHVSYSFLQSSVGIVIEKMLFKLDWWLAREFLFPQYEEQQKIAEFLSSLDDLIAAEGRKLETLKDHKKGLMQQLFPREGDTRPRLRFPEFRDRPEWEETSLGQIVGFRSGGTPPKSNPAYWNGAIPWVSAKDMKQLYLDDTEDHITAAAVDNGAKQVPAGTVLMLTRGMTLLKDVPICFLRHPMSFNQDVRALRPKGDLDGGFLPYLLLATKQRLLRMVDVAGHGTGRLDTEKLKALELMIPKPSEQRRIAACLSSLDDLIPAQADKLDALRTHKRGLMQQLFPVPSREGAAT